MLYVWLADIVVAVHVAYVACVVFGLVLVLLGKAFGWGWVHNRWFRGIHLAMILIVVARSLVWEECPLTTWEDDLRVLGEQVDLEGSRVGYVLHAVIHPGLPMWSYPVIYALFACFVVATLWVVPVAWRSPNEQRPHPPRPPLPRGGGGARPDQAGGGAARDVPPVPPLPAGEAAGG